jgi:hypothetical protein
VEGVGVQVNPKRRHLKYNTGDVPAPLMAGPDGWAGALGSLTDTGRQDTIAITPKTASAVRAEPL